MNIDEIISRNVETVIEKKHIQSRLLSGDRLTIKFGVDPTKPDLHLGHTVALLKLRQFAQMGHRIIFLIGDFTARIGDPSERDITRPILTKEEINENTKTYLNQVSKVLDIKRIEIVKNSQWYEKMNLSDFLGLMSHFTVAQILEREDFTKRIKVHRDIAMQEITYPMLQAYDSIMLKPDIEIGGRDQLFNMMAGRDLMKKMGQKPQDIITLNLLIGTDGKRKMSKSLNNYIAITESASEQFGKIMSIPDSLIINYFEMATLVPESEIKKIKLSLKKKGTNPKEIKIRLAKEIITMYHGADMASKAASEFEQVFSKGGLPENISEIELDLPSISVLDLVVRSKQVKSRGEARRLIEQKAVEFEDMTISDPFTIVGIHDGAILKIGKRRFVRLRITK